MSILKISNIKLLNANVRLCLPIVEAEKYFHKPIISIYSNSSINNIQLKRFSLQSSIESIAKTQTGVFKTLSESIPVEYAQKFLLTVHENTGLPWWGTIITSTILLRTCVTLPLAVYQYHIMAKVENLKLEMNDIVKELKRETAAAIKIYNWDERMARITYNRSVRKQWRELIERDNCHPFKSTILLLFQIPMWISLSIALRNLVYMLPKQDLDAMLTYTELSKGGFGFIPNLTEVDSSLIFPILLGIINLLIIEIQVLSRINTPTKTQRYLTNFFRGLTIITIPIAASVPSCLVLYWTTSSTFGLFQNLALLSPTVKRFCQIPKTIIEVEHPYQHLMLRLKNKFSFVQNKIK